MSRHDGDRLVGQAQIEVGQVTGALDELEDGAGDDETARAGHRGVTSRRRPESVSATT